jgi:hypothetical protein
MTATKEAGSETTTSATVFIGAANYIKRLVDRVAQD